MCPAWRVLDDWMAPHARQLRPKKNRRIVHKKLTSLLPHDTISAPPPSIVSFRVLDPQPFGNLFRHDHLFNSGRRTSVQRVQDDRGW